MKILNEEEELEAEVPAEVPAVETPSDDGIED